VARLAAKQQTGVAPLGLNTLPHMARLWPAYLMWHGAYLAHLVFSNEKACWPRGRPAEVSNFGNASLPLPSDFE